MRSKMLRAGRDVALLWLGIALIRLPAARAAGGVLEPECSEAVDNEIRDRLCQGGLVVLAIQPRGAEALLCMPPPVAWNGDLIAFARGNALFPPPPEIPGGECKLAGMLGQLDIDDVSLPQLANELGFGFATTSCSGPHCAARERGAAVPERILGLAAEHASEPRQYLLPLEPLAPGWIPGAADVLDQFPAAS